MSDGRITTGIYVDESKATIELSNAVLAPSKYWYKNADEFFKDRGVLLRRTTMREEIKLFLHKIKLRFWMEFYKRRLKW